MDERPRHQLETCCARKAPRIAPVLVAFAAVCASVHFGPCAGYAWAEPAEQLTRPAPRPPDRPARVSLTVGSYGAMTGPSTYGAAVELEVIPGICPGFWPGCSPRHWLSRTGLGIYYRSSEGSLSEGMLTAGVAFEAAAARPLLSMGLHGELGYDTATSLPVAGGGMRAQLMPLPPLSLAMNMTGHFFVDGIRTRLALGVALTIGIAW